MYLSGGVDGARPLGDLNPFQVGGVLSLGLRLEWGDGTAWVAGVRGVLHHGESSGLVHVGERTWSVEGETGVRPVHAGGLFLVSIGMGQGTQWLPGLERSTDAMVPFRLVFGWSVPLVPHLALDATCSVGSVVAIGDVFSSADERPWRALVSAGVGLTWLP